MVDQEPECVLERVDYQLELELQEFWWKHKEAFRAEINSFRVLDVASAELFGQSGRPLSRHPVVIVRDEAGNITGVVYVVLRKIDSSLNLGTHAYFQRMYIVPGSRCCRVANRLFRLFLLEFDKASGWRDYRARVLLTENINPGLRKASMRRYFARLGFRLLGANRLGGEVWLRRLPVRFVF